MKKQQVQQKNNFHLKIVEAFPMNILIIKIKILKKFKKKKKKLLN